MDTSTSTQTQDTSPLVKEGGAMPDGIRQLMDDTIKEGKNGVRLKGWIAGITGIAGIAAGIVAATFVTPAAIIGTAIGAGILGIISLTSGIAAYHQNTSLNQVAVALDNPEAQLAMELEPGEKTLDGTMQGKVSVSISDREKTIHLKDGRIWTDKIAQSYNTQNRAL